MKALIIDDEHLCRENLRMLIESYCPAIHESASAVNASDARKQLSIFQPDILFLDVKMPGENGFDFLASLGDHPYSVIFTTAHSEFALPALKAEALDYLEKPVNIDDLQKAVKKLDKRRQLNAIEDHIKIAQNKTQPGTGNEKIAIAMREGFEIISFNEIIHLEASESYTTFYLGNGKRIISSKNIKVYEDRLDPAVFFRIHKSHIINVRNHLTGFNRRDGNSAVMSNGKMIPISRRKLQQFLDLITGM